MTRLFCTLAVAGLALVPLTGQPGAASGKQEAGSGKLDPESVRWIAATLKKTTLDEKVGQLIVSSFRAEYLTTDSDQYEALVKSIQDYKIGGFHVFGGTEPVPDVLLGAHYGTVMLGQPLAAASILNRLRAIAPYPLPVTADFETGAGFRLEGATAFPRNMAFGAAGDEKLAYEAGRITAVESRAIGVHVNFAPVVDVNNNPRNPVINTRSYGEDPDLVGRLGASYVRGLQGAGDRPERSAVRALAGEAPITGKLPIGLTGLAERGAGLTSATR